VASKPFTESEIVGEMIAQLAEADGISVERRFFLGGTVCFEGLKSGDLDAYVEYTGTGLVNLLQEPPSGDPAAVYARVKDEFARRWGLIWAAPLGFENSYALVMRRDRAAAARIRTISDLVRSGLRLSCGFDLEFADRPDGWKGLKAAYGLDSCREVRQMNSGLLYDALASRRTDLISGYTTDGRVKTLDLLPLTDDRRFFPPYQAAPLLGPKAFAKDPALRARLDALAGKVTDAEMRAMNSAVDQGKRSAREVAREFLIKERLLE
jgi:osmoprotectant transport system permease protein